MTSDLKQGADSGGLSCVTLQPIQMKRESTRASPETEAPLATAGPPLLHPPATSAERGSQSRGDPAGRDLRRRPRFASPERTHDVPGALPRRRQLGVPPELEAPLGIQQVDQV